MFPTENAICRDNGGGGNRTRETFPPELRCEAKTGYVYFIQAGNDGPIKIGWATHPEVRCARLQVANPHPLRILAAVPVRERGVETALHRQFAAHLIRGEWFLPHPDILAFVTELQRDPLLGLMLAPVEPVDPEFAADDDDYNLELAERREASA